MRGFMRLPLIAALGALMLGAGIRLEARAADFPIEKDELVSTGRNPYFILEPGYVLILEGGNSQLTIIVLSETKMVDGVETRVVVERETKGGRLEEVSKNYFAISKRTNDVFYFGEDVSMYKDDKVVSRAGSWLSGVKRAKFGLMMPGKVSLNVSYYHERAPKVAMDQAKIVSMSEIIKTPAGEFTNCLKVEETNPLQPSTPEFKYYAPGVGMVQYGSLKLVKFGKAEELKN